MTPAQYDARFANAIDLLRHATRAFGECNETFNQSFTMAELLTLHRAWMVCGWDFSPDRWTERQVDEALAGTPPNWDEHERPLYGVALPSTPTTSPATSPTRAQENRPAEK